VSYVLLRFKVAALPVTLSLLGLWFGAALGFWFLI
jgi:hypothetical protein